MTKDNCITKNGNSFIYQSHPNRIEKEHLSISDTGILPRLLTRQQAATYCGLSVQGFSQWVKVGRMPRPIAGTARWDLKAIDMSLDATIGFDITQPEDAFDKWKRERNAKRTSRHS